MFGKKGDEHEGEGQMAHLSPEDRVRARLASLEKSLLSPESADEDSSGQRESVAFASVAAVASYEAPPSGYAPSTQEDTSSQWQQSAPLADAADEEDERPKMASVPGFEEYKPEPVTSFAHQEPQPWQESAVTYDAPAAQPAYSPVTQESYQPAYAEAEVATPASSGLYGTDTPSPYVAPVAAAPEVSAENLWGGAPEAAASSFGGETTNTSYAPPAVESQCAEPVAAPSVESVSVDNIWGGETASMPVIEAVPSSAAMAVDEPFRASSSAFAPPPLAYEPLELANPTPPSAASIEPAPAFTEYTPAETVAPVAASFEPAVEDAAPATRIADISEILAQAAAAQNNTVAESAYSQEAVSAFSPSFEETRVEEPVYASAAPVAEAEPVSPYAASLYGSNEAPQESAFNTASSVVDAGNDSVSFSVNNASPEAVETPSYTAATQSLWQEQPVAEPEGVTSNAAESLYTTPSYNAPEPVATEPVIYTPEPETPSYTPSEERYVAPEMGMPIPSPDTPFVSYAATVEEPEAAPTIAESHHYEEAEPLHHAAEIAAVATIASAAAHHWNEPAPQAPASVEPFDYTSVSEAPLSPADASSQLRLIAEQHQLWLNTEGKEGKRATFRDGRFANADFSGLLFVEASFRGASLGTAKFHGTNLQRADFAEAEMDGADFDGANLYRTNFQRARLYRTRFVRAAASEADFSNAELAECQFNQANLEQAVFRDGHYSYTHFDQANMVAAKCRGGHFSHSVFDQAHMNQADCKEANFSHARFVDTHLSQTQFKNAVMAGVNMYLADFTVALDVPAEAQAESVKQEKETIQVENQKLESMRTELRTREQELDEREKLLDETARSQAEEAKRDREARIALARRMMAYGRLCKLTAISWGLVSLTMLGIILLVLAQADDAAIDMVAIIVVVLLLLAPLALAVLNMLRSLGISKKLLDDPLGHHHVE